MPKNEFVVELTSVGGVSYLTGIILGSPNQYIFGNLGDAIIYNTLQEAQDMAAAIGGGTVGTVKP